MIHSKAPYIRGVYALVGAIYYIGVGMANSIIFIRVSGALDLVCNLGSREYHLTSPHHDGPAAPNNTKLQLAQAM